MVKLFCAIVGAAGSAFSVRVDESDSVDDLKKAIWEEIKEMFIHDDKFRSVVASRLQLFLAKKDGAWLKSKDPAVIAMRSGGVPEKVKALLDVEMDPADEIGDLFGDAPTKRTIHVLVVSDGSNVAKDSSLPSAITHSENRRKRWRELNEILDKNKKAKTNGVDGSSTGT
ncbi:unnamed protein product [Phytophthora lilii]|uniref:Unnamed protein product n=1 Tax=Phytophthora lilii TaxID=2077276 RepID=A0A9W6WHF6_9STRA|nr:unnamed protein product [Phytophthora lilii]